MPAEACFVNAPVRPSYDKLTADGRITVAALFGQMDYKRALNDDHGKWSANTLRDTLKKMGYVRTLHRPDRDHSRFQKNVRKELVVVIDVIGPAALPHHHGHKVVGPALAKAINSHEVVYFNGHDFEGKLRPFKRPASLPADEYRVLLLDTCWSQQHYSVPILKSRKHYHVISNTERSITGSVDSFVELLDRLVHAAATRTDAPWPRLLAEMNRLASERAVQRILRDPRTKYPAPEHYGLSSVCTRL